MHKRRCSSGVIVGNLGSSGSPGSPVAPPPPYQASLALSYDARMTVKHLACQMRRTRTYRRRMIRLLAMGQCAIELDGSRLTAESEVVFGLLLYLAGRAGDAVAREDAQSLLWPELPRTRGRHCLRQAAYRLRQLGVPLRADNGSLGVALGDVTSDFAPLVADNAPASAYRHAGIGDILPGFYRRFLRLSPLGLRSIARK